MNQNDSGKVFFSILASDTFEYEYVTVSEPDSEVVFIIY